MAEGTSISITVSDMMNEITATKQVHKTGNSLYVTVSKEIKMLGLGEGDFIEIVIKVKE